MGILEWVIEKGIEGVKHHALKAVGDGFGKEKGVNYHD